MSGLSACLCRAARTVRCGARWGRSRPAGAGTDEAQSPLRRRWSSSSPADAGTDEAQSPLRRLLDGAASYGEGGAAAETGELQWATEPYVTRPSEPPPPRKDPRDSVVLLFPGQGSQYVGMGSRLMHLPAVRDLYDLAAETLKWDVARVCREGPAEQLSARCQVCVLVTSLAALEAARDARPGLLERVRGAAGFSLGELTALVAAGALPLEPALRLVELRAAAMAAAAAGRAGGLLTVWLAADARLSAALRAARDTAAEQGLEDPVADVANYLYPNCKVIAGDELVLQWLEGHGAQFGIRRAARVSVAGAFHSRLMQPAAEPLHEALRLLEPELRTPAVPVISNVDAKPYRSVKQMVRQLPRQLVSPVRWEQSLQALYARGAGSRFPLTLALGPGRTARATLKQVNAKAWDDSLQVDA